LDMVIHLLLQCDSSFLFHRVLIGLQIYTKRYPQIKMQFTDPLHTDDEIKTNLSDYISKKLNYNYTYLANLFSEVKGTTIEHFYLTHKIEKVKELLVYDELNLTEIAYRLHYSSVAHLSNQFKKMTGLTPSHFKNLKFKKRKDLGSM